MCRTFCYFFYTWIFAVKPDFGFNFMNPIYVGFQFCALNFLTALLKNIWIWYAFIVLTCWMLTRTNSLQLARKNQKKKKKKCHGCLLGIEISNGKLFCGKRVSRKSIGACRGWLRRFRQYLEIKPRACDVIYNYYFTKY